MHARTIAIVSLLLGAAVGAVSGCGGQGTIFVTGTVTLDGKPLPDAVVAFAPKDGRRPATGRTDAEGNFQLSTFSANDGALPGEHVVIITACQPVIRRDVPGLGLDEGPSTVELKWIAPERYSHPETSGLSATVSNAQNRFTFSLTSP